MAAKANLYGGIWTVRRVKRWKVPFFRLWYRWRYRGQFKPMFFGRPLTPSEICGRFLSNG